MTGKGATGKKQKKCNKAKIIPQNLFKIGKSTVYLVQMG